MRADDSLPPVREAIALPFLLLTVGLVGSIRIDAAGQLVFLGPTLFALVLAVMLAGLLLRSGLLAPERLVSPARGPLANLNGLTVAMALLFASGQVFTMLTPEGGLLQLLFNVFFLAMLWMMATARPQGARLVRSLVVLFGWALVLRFVILNGLAAPEGSVARRLFAAALEGLALGALGLTYQAPATGYLAFLMLALFFIALLLLPSRAWQWSLVGAQRSVRPALAGQTRSAERRTELANRWAAADREQPPQRDAHRDTDVTDG
jgi:hypothetical protein